MQIQGRYCVVFPDVTVGEDTRLGNFVLIRSNTQTGQGCIVGSYVDIEGDGARAGHADGRAPDHRLAGLVGWGLPDSRGH